MSAAASLESRIEALEQQLTQSAELISKLEQERDEYRKLCKLLQEQNERLKRGLLGQKAERLPSNDAQLALAILGITLDGESPSEVDNQPDEEQKIAEHTRRRPVRKAFPDSWLRIPIEILPPEVLREGRDAFELIGTDTREVLERRPASTVVVQLIYQKFVRKDRQRGAETEVFAPEAVELPIERGLAGPTMLADTIVRRWQDNQPLNRLEGIYAREGLDLAKSTICTWHEQLGCLVEPLVEAMFEDAYQAPYVCVDATGVLVQAKERCRHGHFWVLVVPEKHVLFRYSAHHDKAAVDNLLAGYKGYAVLDAHVVYDHLFKTGDLIEVACWAHARRYWFKALESDPERAKTGLAHIAGLFRIEGTIADAPRKKKEEVRQSKSKPIVQRFFAWCDSQVDLVLDESPAAAAIGYARNQRVALQRFLDDGRLPLHNNISELNLRREVTGRHAWLFVGNDEAARINTIFVSLLASCRLHDIEPLGYIRDLLCLLPSWPRSRVLELAPAYWKNTLEQHETQQKLAANVFRRVVLSLP